jgi:holo-[acyl-carrier protein] synthase
MIVGIGIDIVRNDRIKRATEIWGERFLNRIYTSREQEYCRRRSKAYLHFGARFAVKEAMIKAAGTVRPNGIQWKDIEIENLESGQPVVRVTGRFEKILLQKHVDHIHVSMSHDNGYAVGQVVLESR